MSIALVFPGQGAQYVGMGKALYKDYKVARDVFEEASEIMNIAVSDLCFEGSVSRLAQHENTNIGLLTCSVAAYRVFTEENELKPVCMAGHSLGEYAALACSGFLKFSDTLRLIYARGLLTAKARNMNLGTMSIIDGIDYVRMEQICHNSTDVYVSCYNAVSQVAVSGTAQAVNQVEEKCAELQARVTPLLNSAPIHCPLMEPVVPELVEEIQKIKAMQGNCPVISSISGDFYDSDGSNVRSLLARQVLSAVRWLDVYKHFQRSQITHVVELGPKNTLTVLMQNERMPFQAFSYGSRLDRDAFKKLKMEMK